MAAHIRIDVWTTRTTEAYYIYISKKTRLVDYGLKYLSTSVLYLLHHYKELDSITCEVSVSRTERFLCTENRCYSWLFIELLTHYDCESFAFDVRRLIDRILGNWGGTRMTSRLFNAVSRFESLIAREF